MFVNHLATSFITVLAYQGLLIALRNRKKPKVTVNLIPKAPKSCFYVVFLTVFNVFCSNSVRLSCFEIKLLKKGLH